MWILGDTVQSMTQPLGGRSYREVVAMFNLRREVVQYPTIANAHACQLLVLLSLPWHCEVSEVTLPLVALPPPDSPSPAVTAPNP